MVNGREKHSNFEGGPGYPRLVAFASWRIGSTLVLWLFFFAFFVLFLKCLRALLRSIADAFQDVFGQLSDSGNQVQQIQPQQQAAHSSNHSYWRPGNIADRSGQYLSTDVDVVVDGGVFPADNPPRYDAHHNDPLATATASTTESMPNAPEEAPPAYDTLFPPQSSTSASSENNNK